MANLGNGEKSRKPQQSPSSSSSSFDVFQSQKNEEIKIQSQKSNFDTSNNNNPRKRRKKPTSKPTTITTTTEDTIFQLILNQIETKKPKNNFKSRYNNILNFDFTRLHIGLKNKMGENSAINNMQKKS